MTLRRYPQPRHLSSVLLLISVAVLSACGGGTSTASDRRTTGGDGVATRIAPADRQVLPPVSGGLLGGDKYDSRKNVGKVVVYNVWGSWCAPCRSEAPGLRRVWNETRDQGVAFVGINVKDNDGAARAFERTFDVTYPSITTADSGKALLAFGGALPRRAVPSTVVVDRKGRVAARVLGATTYSTLKSLVEGILTEKAYALTQPAGIPPTVRTIR